MDITDEAILAAKFTLCLLFTQFGKTFIGIERIKTEIEDDVRSGRSIHLVYTMNTLLCNNQFAQRLSSLEKEFGVGTICIFNSESKELRNFTHVRSRETLQGLCFDRRTCPRVVVMCSNSRRFDDGRQFLSAIDTNRTNISRAFVYYDELHKYIGTRCDSHTRQQIEKIHELNVVKSIIAFTGTPDKIFMKHGFWSHIQTINLKEHTERDYVGYHDMAFTYIDYSRGGTLDDQCIEYIEYIIDQYPHILAENTRTFIPAHVRCLSHERVRDLIFKKNYNAVIVLLNGQEKSLQYRNEQGITKTIPISTEKIACEIIADIIVKHDLEKRPLVITGFRCVECGQTLISELLGSFTSAIFSHLDQSNDSTYQLFGRTTGRMKQWTTYCQTQIYCPAIFMQRCRVMENCVRHMITEYNGEVVTQDDYRRPLCYDYRDHEAVVGNLRDGPPRRRPNAANPLVEHLLDSYEEVVDYWEKNLKGRHLLDTNRANTEVGGPPRRRRQVDKDGFIEARFGGKRRKRSVEELQGHEFLGWSNNKYWYYPCYEHIEDLSSLKHYIAHYPVG